MGEHAFIGMIAQQSVPIQGIQPLFNSADYKKNLAMKESAQLANGLRGNATDYYKRMAEFNTKLNEKRMSEREADADKRWREIENMNLGQTSDPYKLKYGLDRLNSFFRFAQFNTMPKSVDNQIYASKKLFNQNTERYAQIKEGKEADNGENPLYMASEFQNAGERNFLT